MVTHLCYSEFQDILGAIDRMDGEPLRQEFRSNPGQHLLFAMGLGACALHPFIRLLQMAPAFLHPRAFGWLPSCHLPAPPPTIAAAGAATLTLPCPGLFPGLQPTC